MTFFGYLVTLAFIWSHVTKLSTVEYVVYCRKMAEDLYGYKMLILTKAQHFLFSGVVLYTNANLHINIIYHFCQKGPLSPKSVPDNI